MRVEFFFSAFLFVASAGAAEDKLATPWNDLDSQCQAWDLKSTTAFAKGAVAWDHSEHAVQDNIVHFTHEVCPAYLGSANASSSVGQASNAMTLEKFTSELQRVYSEVIDAKSKAEKQQGYLDKNIERLTKFFAGGGWSIKDHPCGARFLERRKYVTLELERLRKNVDSIRTECPKASDILAAKGLSAGMAVRAGAVKGQGSVSESPAARAKTPTSDITGVKQDQEKRP